MGWPLECRRDCRGSLVVQPYCISCFPGYLTVYPVNGFAPKYLRDQDRRENLRAEDDCLTNDREQHRGCGGTSTGWSVQERHRCD